MRTREFRYQPGDVVPGTTLRIVRPIGYGGMGAVYEVEQTFTEIRYVLKVIHPELISGKGMLARMEKEAKVLAKLKHTNIVQVVWAGVTDESPKLFYYVMEKLEGYTLRRLIRKANERGIKLRLDFVLRMMISLLNALAYAHAHGIIHRDVKPDNVFVHIGEIIKLLDFGIVLELGRRRTTSRGFVGTLGYGAPEQITGAELTPAADLWAVGVVLFELLTGREPFGGQPTEYAMAQAVLFKPCGRPSEFRPEIPRTLDELVVQLLEKEPAKRPPHAIYVASELERIRAELAERPSPEHADIVGLDLLDSMGPPSITNVDEDLEEEVPPSSDSRADSFKGPADPPPVAGAQVLGAPPRKATELLSPSVVAQAVRKAAPVRPPLLATPAGAAGVAQAAQSSAEGTAGNPETQKTDVSAGPPVPWADAMRLLQGSPTVRCPPLPEALALSLRDAKTPALGTIPVAPLSPAAAAAVVEGRPSRSDTPCVALSAADGPPVPAHSPQQPLHLAPAPSPVGPAVSPGQPRTAFQPFQHADPTAAAGPAVAAGGAAVAAAHPAVAEARVATAAADGAIAAPGPVAAAPGNAGAEAGAAIAAPGNAVAAVGPGAPAFADASRRHPSGGFPKGETVLPRAEPGMPIATQPSGVDPGPQRPRIGAGAVPPATERQAQYQPRAVIDWDAPYVGPPVVRASPPQAGGSALAERVESQLPEDERASTYRSVASRVVESPESAIDAFVEGRVTTNPASVSTAPHPSRAVLSRSFGKVFAAALGGSLIVFGLIALIWTAFRSPSPGAVASRPGIGPSSGVVAPVSTLPGLSVPGSASIEPPASPVAAATASEPPALPLIAASGQGSPPTSNDSPRPNPAVPAASAAPAPTGNSGTAGDITGVPSAPAPKAPPATSPSAQRTKVARQHVPSPAPLPAPAAAAKPPPSGDDPIGASLISIGDGTPAGGAASGKRKPASGRTTPPHGAP